MDSFNLGLASKEWFVTGLLSTMKRGEVSLASIQQLRLDAGVKAKDYEVYYQVQLIDYTTVVDLDMDFNYMKSILTHGTSNQRAREADLLDAVFELHASGETVFEGSLARQAVTQYASDPNMLKLVRGMKPGEKSSTEIKRDAYLARL